MFTANYTSERAGHLGQNELLLYISMVVCTQLDAHNSFGLSVVIPSWGLFIFLNKMKSFASKSMIWSPRCGHIPALPLPITPCLPFSLDRRKFGNLYWPAVKGRRGALSLQTSISLPGLSHSASAAWISSISNTSPPLHILTTVPLWPTQLDTLFTLSRITLVMLQCY